LSTLYGSGGENGQRITMVARFEERKGHRHVLLALKNLITEHPEYVNLKLLLFGDGPLLQTIKNLALAVGIEENVVFLGHRNDRISYVVSSLFLVNPSLGYESLPYSILEAMSVGVPAIGTNVGGIPEEIENGVTGIIVPAADIGALSRAMFILLSNNEKRIKMGTAAKERFKELFTADRMVESYMSLYESSIESIK